MFTCLGFLALLAIERSPWYKSLLYQELLHGTYDQRLSAATALVRVRGEPYLLAGLKLDDPEPRELARRGLEQLWFTAAGGKAYDLAMQSYEAAEIKDFVKALDILNGLLNKYPRFAEAWNRRASVHWELGEYEKSIADCRRALELNPNHYGAWQGLGLCQLQLGKIEEACQSLRAALKILPHDEGTLQSLKTCEELLRTFPLPERFSKKGDLI